MSRLSDAVNALAAAVCEAQTAMDGPSGDAEHDALVALIDAAERVIDSWEN